MIATLEELCIKQTAVHIVEGRLKTAAQKLGPESSNLVFVEFMMFNGQDKFSESCRYIKNLLTVTKVELYGYPPDENMREMVCDQNIQELALGPFVDWHKFRLRREDPQDLPRKTPVTICVVLERLLNPESYRKLTELEITGTDIRFTMRCAEKIARTLPSLKTLKLLDTKTDKETIQSIFKNLPNLRELDIPGSQITNLNGISKMSKLTVLDISEINFGGPEDIQELFELKNLKMLLVHGEFNRHPSNFMLYYMETEKCLPQLEHLICSYCDVTGKMIRKLLRSHKSLKYIDLMGTSLQHHTQIPGKQVKLFTMGTFKDCLDTAKMYVGYTVVHDFLSPIMRKFCTLLDEQYDQISQTELSECLELMCKILSTYDRLRAAAVDVLEKMCWDKRAEMYSFAEKQHLIYTICNSIEKDVRKDMLSDMLTDEPVWEILSNQVILSTSPENLNKLCEYAVLAFHEYVLHRGGYLPITFLIVLANNLDNMSIDRAKALVNNTQFEKDVLQVLRSLVRNKTDEAGKLQFLTTIIHKIYVISDEQSERTMEVDKECVNVFCDAIITFQDDFKNQVDLVVTLGNIIGLMHDEAVRVLLMDEDVFLVLMEMFYDQYTRRQRVAVNLLHSTFLKTNANSLELLEDKPLEEVQKFLVKDVQIQLQGFKETSGDVLDGLKWILEESQSKMTKEMFKWIVEEYGKEKEERPFEFEYNFTHRYPIESFL
ncbi:hypothetical protein CAEBREN_24406 [Caenorhabditis brenneri]|uniref:Uncharacterized protein n=1 Tax=Caenorhabditis brenneri TaxID=135651 RepID=G0MMW8_CAEBE|nr:hypothetical protein CAEBREN_24406 [Caenorhabditis brenneri]